MTSLGMCSRFLRAAACAWLVCAAGLLPARRAAAAADACGYPFGSGRTGLTDIFFLVCCRDDRTHLRVLARLARLLRRPGFIDELRAADTVGETWRLIDATERELITA